MRNLLKLTTVAGHGVLFNPSAIVAIEVIKPASADGKQPAESVIVLPNTSLRVTGSPDDVAAQIDKLQNAPPASETKPVPANTTVA